MVINGKYCDENEVGQVDAEGRGEGKPLRRYLNMDPNGVREGPVTIGGGFWVEGAAGLWWGTCGVVSCVCLWLFSL